jgi:hypothetical protein
MGWSEKRGSIMGKAEWHVLLWSIYVLSEILANMYHYPEGAYGPLVRDTLLSMPIILGAFYFIHLFYAAGGDRGLLEPGVLAVADRLSG